MWSDFLRGIVVRWRDETLAKNLRKKTGCVAAGFCCINAGNS
jgi:hypothetical protein